MFTLTSSLRSSRTLVSSFRVLSTVTSRLCHDSLLERKIRQPSPTPHCNIWFPACLHSARVHPAF